MKTTSAAVIGVPLVNFTPLRMVKVSDLLPAPHFQEVASHGVVLPLCSVLTKTSGSYTTRPTAPWWSRLNGLKPQVHSWPASLEMVTVCRPWADPPLLELVPEPEELQAAASRPAATRTPAIRRRLIVVALH